jgi:hypothetical protein
MRLGEQISGGTGLGYPCARKIVPKIVQRVRPFSTCSISSLFRKLESGEGHRIAISLCWRPSDKCRVINTAIVNIAGHIMARFRRTAAGIALLAAFAPTSPCYTLLHLLRARVAWGRTGRCRSEMQKRWLTRRLRARLALTQQRVLERRFSAPTEGAAPAPVLAAGGAGWFARAERLV